MVISGVIVLGLVAVWTFSATTVAQENAVPKAATTPIAGPEPTAATRYLTVAASVFHVQAGSDFEKALNGVETGTSFDFIRKSESFRTMPMAWTYFFNTSIVVVGNHPGRIHVIGFYNVFLDAVVLTQWKIGPKNLPEIIAGTIRSGAELQSGQLSGVAATPRWMASEEFAPVALRKQFSDFATAFNRRFPANTQTHWSDYAALSTTTLETIGSHAQRQVLDLYMLQNEAHKEVVETIRAFRAAWATGDTTRLGALLPENNTLPLDTLIKTPAEFRTRAVPVYVVWANREAVVFLADPQSPRFYGILHLGTLPPVKVRSVRLFDLTPREI